jgi:flagellar biogenesis protein FliO
MEDVLSLVELTLYVIGILALSMAITWLVVRISPSESAKEQRAKQSSGT